MDEFLIGDTMTVTWINSDVTPTDIHCAVFDGANPETLVDSITMTASGNGHYWNWHTIPDTPGLYVVETLATIAARPFKRRIPYRAIIGEVD